MLNKMLTYDLKVGYACNNKCKHCVIDDSKDKLIEQQKNINLSTLECLKQIDIASKKGVTNIVLTGGEVTIRKDFSELIKKCTEYNLNITIQTNGRMLHHESIINTIKDVKNIKFIVALHGANKETHDSITQVNGSFEETCAGIKKMCDIGKFIILKVVISHINFKELPEIIHLGTKLGIKYFCFAFPHGQGAARKNFDKIMLTYSSLKPILKKLIFIAKENNSNIEFEAIPFCIIPNNMNLVGELKYYTGDTICTQVHEDTFQWNKIRKSIKKKGSNCINCDMNEFCEGPWSEYIDNFGDTELQPIIFPQKYKEIIISKIKKSLCK